MEAHIKMAEKIDRRIIHTKRSIRNALVELLTKKDIDNITVRELADTASISRKTFYNYYTGVYDVMQEVEDNLMAQFDAYLAKVHYSELLNDPTKMYVRIGEVLSQDADFYRYLLSIDRNSSFMIRLISMIRGKLKVSMREQLALADRHLDVLLEFLLPAVMNAYHYWFNHSSDFSIDELSRLMSVITVRGALGFYDMVKLPR